MKKITALLLCVTALNLLVVPPSMGAFFNKNKEQVDSPEFQQILTVLETGLDIKTSRKGDVFRAKILENISLDEKTVLVPANSYLAGRVIKVQKSTLFKKDSYIRISINGIENPEGEVTSLNPPYVTEIFNPGTKKFKKRLIDKMPASIASSGTSFILGQSSTLVRGAIWGISIGAGACAGMIAGYIKPDVDKTRLQTGSQRAFNATPFSSVRLMLSKGKSFSLEEGQYITVYLDQQALRAIMQNCPTVGEVELNKELQPL